MAWWNFAQHLLKQCWLERSLFQMGHGAHGVSPSHKPRDVPLFQNACQDSPPFFSDSPSVPHDLYLTKNGIEPLTRKYQQTPDNTAPRNPKSPSLLNSEHENNNTIANGSALPLRGPINPNPNLLFSFRPDTFAIFSRSQHQVKQRDGG